MRKWINLLFIILILSACGIEGIEQIPELNPPLGLTASMSTNNTILLRFYSSNPEDFLTGFYVYIADSDEELNNGTGTRMPNAEFDSTKPTIWRNVTPSSNVQVYQITFDKNHDLQNFEVNFTYHFMVQAYSSEKNIYSPDSNLTNVTYLTN